MDASQVKSRLKMVMKADLLQRERMHRKNLSLIRQVTVTNGIEGGDSCFYVIS